MFRKVLEILTQNFMDFESKYHEATFFGHFLSQKNAHLQAKRALKHVKKSGLILLYYPLAHPETMRPPPFLTHSKSQIPGKKVLKNGRFFDPKKAKKRSKKGGGPHGSVKSVGKAETNAN